MKRTILGLTMIAATVGLAVRAVEEQYRDILALKPLSFWPADEGSGTALRDLGTLGNNANLFNTAWQGGMLDFTGGYEFIEIPT